MVVVCTTTAYMGCVPPKITNSFNVVPNSVDLGEEVERRDAADTGQDPVELGDVADALAVHHLRQRL